MMFHHSIRNLPKRLHVLTQIQRLKTMVLETDCIIVIPREQPDWGEGTGERLGKITAGREK